MMMDSNKNNARFAGLTYLIVILTGIFSLAYVPSRLIDLANANKTFQNISDSQELYRLLMMGCSSYLRQLAGETLINDFSKTSLAQFTTLPATLGEIGTCLRLLIIGGKINE